MFKMYRIDGEWYVYHSLSLKKFVTLEDAIEYVMEVIEMEADQIDYGNNETPYYAFA